MVLYPWQYVVTLVIDKLVAVRLSYEDYIFIMSFSSSNKLI